MIKSRDCISFARGIVGHVPAQKSLSVTGESRFRDLPGIDVPPLSVTRRLDSTISLNNHAPSKSVMHY